MTDNIKSEQLSSNPNDKAHYTLSISTGTDVEPWSNYIPIKELAVVSPLVKALQYRQTNLGASNKEFAKLLGISPSYWSGLCKGKSKVGLKIIQATIDTFPELESIIFVTKKPWWQKIIRIWEIG